MNITERLISPEQKNTNIDERIMSYGFHAAHELVGKLAKGEDGTRSLEYHAVPHTTTVESRCRTIVEVIRQSGIAVDERDADILQLAAAFHDIVRSKNEVTIDEPETSKWNGLSRRTYEPMLKGENEKDSEDYAVAYMDLANKEFLGNFTDEDKAKIQRQIAVTIPAFDPETRTVVQPNLTERSTMYETTLALADLGAAGMGGREEFLPEGDALFRENNLDIMDSLRALSAGEGIDLRHQMYFRERMLAWTEGQIAFAEGRKARLDAELASLGPKAQERLKKEVFMKFDDSILGAQERNERRQKMSFSELTRDMGYELAQ